MLYPEALNQSCSSNHLSWNILKIHSKAFAVEFYIRQQTKSLLPSQICAQLNIIETENIRSMASLYIFLMEEQNLYLNLPEAAQ